MRTINTPVILLGPTASGKTEVSLSLAKKIGGEIICADSMQVYRHMDIGTAKPSRSQTRLVRHHLLDIKTPDENFSAGEFKQLAEKAILSIIRRKGTPIITGGTGLYIKTITDGLCPVPGEDKKTREHLARLASKHGNMYLYRRLARIDPETAKKTHSNNLKRIIRSLEIYTLTGHKPSSLHAQNRRISCSFKMFGLKWERGALYRRIDGRVEEMIKEGLIAEAKKLLKMGYGPSFRSMQSIGYRHATEFLMGKYDFNTMGILMKRDTRRYAKRQMTWWRKDGRIRWIEMNDSTTPNEIAEQIVHSL